MKFHCDQFKRGVENHLSIAGARLLRIHAQSYDHAFKQAWMRGGSAVVVFHAIAVLLNMFLSFKTVQDVPTQIFHWDWYRASCRQRRTKVGKFLCPTVAEFLTGPHFEISYCFVMSREYPNHVANSSKTQL